MKCWIKLLEQYTKLQASLIRIIHENNSLIHFAGSPNLGKKMLRNFTVRFVEVETAHSTSRDFGTFHLPFLLRLAHSKISPIGRDRLW
jgi:hypothetical protein